MQLAYPPRTVGDEPFAVAEELSVQTVRDGTRRPGPSKCVRVEGDGGSSQVNPPTDFLERVQVKVK